MARKHNFPNTEHAFTGYVVPNGYPLSSSNAQLLKDEPGETVYLLNAGSIEQPFKITLRSNAIKNVGGLKVVNPPANAGGAVQYSIKIETIGRRVSPSVAGTTEDEGAAMWLTVKHNANDVWNADDLVYMFKSLCAYVVKADATTAGELTSGSYRFMDLAKGITR